MKLEDLNKKYDKLQLKYGAKELDSIYNGGCEENPDICFVFMNPTGKNIASSKDWKGIKSPWLGTKNIWNLFFSVGLLDEDIYKKIKSIKASEWTEQFSKEVYDDVKKHKYFITNLGKCTQIDARPLSDEILKQYLDLLFKEIDIIRPKIIITFGNQVSSIILNKKISVSENRKISHEIEINKNKYKVYPVYYPVGNGIFNIDKSIEDIKWIIDIKMKEKKKMKHKMSLNNGPFNRIKYGTKAIELRLNDEKRQLLKENDLIEFTNKKTSETIIVEIKNLYKYSNFDELYKHFDKISMGYDKDDIANPKDMEQYYSKEEQEKYGVVGIEIKVIEDRK